MMLPFIGCRKGATGVRRVLAYRRFREEGFERYVDQVGQIEKRLGIYDLSIFTPEVKGLGELAVVFLRLGTLAFGGASRTHRHDGGGGCWTVWNPM
jgi:hypothetical protein